MKTKNDNKKKYVLIGATALLAVVAAVFIWLYLTTSANYLSLDVNPGIEIQTNRLGKVTSVEPANEDAVTLLENYRITDNDLDDVVEDLVDLMILNGYITADKPNDVLITVGSDAASQAILRQVNDKIANYLTMRQLNANVMKQSVSIDDNLQQSASQAGVSAGRMALIEKLLSGGALTREELAQMTVADLVEYAYTNNIPLDVLEDQLDNLDNRYGDDALDHLEDGIDDVEDNQTQPAAPSSTPTQAPASTPTPAPANPTPAPTTPNRHDDDDDWDDRYDDHDDDWDDDHDDHDDDWDDRHDDHDDD